MTQVYDILGAVERHFKNNEENTNAVVFGQLDGTDLSKQTIFPLSHFAISDITYDEISGGDVNALGYFGYFNGIFGSQSGGSFRSK